jgi:D-glycero-alpha-D-manno-heptose 1-phosphate guanylyltransferase
VREAIILAGGKGTRLRSVVSDVPKPLAPVAGKPFLELLLRSLLKASYDRVLISVGYKAELIVKCFGDHYQGLPLTYVCEAAPLGTGGAVKLALGMCESDHAVVFNGDTFLEVDHNQLANLWDKHKKPIVVGRQVEDAGRYGRLEVGDGFVKKLLEKGFPGSGIINGGCYVLRVDQLAQFDGDKAFSLESDYLTPAVEEMDFIFNESKGVFIDIGTPEDYYRAQSMFI